MVVTDTHEKEKQRVGSEKGECAGAAGRHGEGRGGFADAALSAVLLSTALAAASTLRHGSLGTGPKL